MSVASAIEHLAASAPSPLVLAEASETHDTGLRIIWCNHAFATLLDCKEAALLETPLCETLGRLCADGALPAKAQRSIQTALAQIQPVAVILPQNPQQTWRVALTPPSKEAESERALWSVALTPAHSDYSAQHLALAKNVQDFETQLVRIGEMTGIGTWELTLATSDVVWSKQTHEIHEVDEGYTPALDEAINFYAPEARPIVEDAVQRGLEHGESWDLELPFITAKGRHIWVRAFGQPVFEDGAPVKVIGAFQDISEQRNQRHRLEEALETSSRALAELEGFFEVSLDFLCIIDMHGRILKANRAFNELTGPTDTPMRPRDLSEFFHQDDLLEARRELSRLRKGDEILDLTLRFKRADGAYRMLEWRAQPANNVVYAAARDVTDRLRSETELKAAKQRAEEISQSFSLATRAAGIGRWMLDLDNWRIGGDMITQTLYGRSTTDDAIEMDVRSWQKYIHEDDLPRILQLMKDALETGGDFGARMRVVGDDGETRHVEAHATHASSSTGGAVLVGVNWDVTGLVEALDQARAASEAKSSFLANMSHEIRTPMNGVLGMASALEDTPLSHTQRNMVQTITQSGSALMRILNDILDFSKIEAGKLELEVTDFDLGELMRSVELLHSLRAREEGLSFTARVDDKAKGRYTGDPTRLRQILNNLISNAIKFTESGSIEVSVERRKAERVGQAELHFTVKDTGQGIAPDTVGRLFTSFTQADASTNRKHGGTGLGLSISKQLSELMGGNIRVESELGKGSSFHFHIIVEPLKTAAGKNGETDEEAGPSPRERLAELSPRVLVAEDNATNRAVLNALLGTRVRELVMTENGDEALKTWRPEAFDIILMDVQMPVMDGVEATQALRRAELELDANRPKIPIIALTANTMRHQFEAYIEAGMDTCVPKPVSPNTLYTAMVELLTQQDAAGEDGGTTAA